ncbi:MAG: ATP-binding protein, partial [Pseudomonadota bacterium]
HLERLHELLRSRIALQTGDDGVTDEPYAPVASSTPDNDDWPHPGQKAPPSLDVLCGLFKLSEFERDLLLLCAAVELDAEFLELCRTAQAADARGVPTLGLALALLDGGHWSALTPAAPLRYWRMLEIGSGDTLMSSPLRIDERVLHHLTGLRYPDEALSAYIEMLPPPESTPGEESRQRLLGEMAAAWSSDQQRWPVLQLSGNDSAARRDLAGMAISNRGLQPILLHADTLPQGASDLTVFTRLWEREAILSNAGLVLEWLHVSDTDAAQRRAIQRFVAGVRSPLVVCSDTRGSYAQREVVNVEISRAPAHEQRDMWHRSLADWGPLLNGQIGQLVAQFDVTEQDIQTVCRQLHHQLGDGDPDPDELQQRIWAECRQQLRPSLDNLAQRIPVKANWDDLVLPARQLETLRDIAIQARHRAQVYGDWGFAEKSSRGLGISALFFGPSGTGKTLAAEVLAGALQLDLYRIDLSQVVSKYIGETEKNLRRIFDAAEGGSAVLLFDEADALFGKRSEVKDSHDRYANIEVSYLLQRIEAFRGLAVLTTNLKDSLDEAFMRRIRFAVHFPFPSAQQREAIWERVFPAQTPLADLSPARLAQLNIAGGSIHNIALHAAFLAAEEQAAVDMTHLLRAARAEYSKLEKPLSDPETRGWV